MCFGGVILPPSASWPVTDSPRTGEDPRTQRAGHRRPAPPPPPSRPTHAQSAFNHHEDTGPASFLFLCHRAVGSDCMTPFLRRPHRERGKTPGRTPAGQAKGLRSSRNRNSDGGSLESRNSEEDIAGCGNQQNCGCFQLRSNVHSISFYNEQQSAVVYKSALQIYFIFIGSYVECNIWM